MNVQKKEVQKETLCRDDRARTDDLCNVTAAL